MSQPACMADTKAHWDRREFLKVSTMAGGGLALSAYWHTGAAQAPPGASGPAGAGGPAAAGGAQAAPAALLVPDAFIKIAPDGAIVIFSARPDVGQGIKTSSAMIVAEELDADWSRVTVEQAPVDGARYGSQSVGGSRSTLTSFDPLRRVGATARALLIDAAAARWGVSAAECHTEPSAVVHRASSRRATYGELAEAAAQLPLPDSATLKLKVRAAYRLIGKPMASVDNPKIVVGTPLYGIDVRVPGMKYASVLRSPVLRAKVASANLDAVRAEPGVREVLVLEGHSMESGEALPGIAVIADSTWQALAARRKLQVRWDQSSASRDDWQAATVEARRLAGGRGTQVLRERGDVGAALAGAAKVVESYYTYPFASHATLEPQNTTAWWHDGVMELWAPVQAVDRARPALARMLGLTTDKVVVHLPRIGGGFGRRLMWDYMTEAALIAQRVSVPVQVLWTREDDLAFDYFRPGGFHALKAGLDARGRLTAWQDHFITFSHDGRTTANTANMDAEEFPAPVLTNCLLTQSLLPLAARTGPWRAPRSNGLSFPMQSFIHELAVAAGRDHLEFLLELMGEPRLLNPQNPQGFHTGRAAAVIRLAAEKSGWGRKLPRGRGLGLAFYFSHAGHFAEVAEVSVSARRELTVHKVTAAGDVGLVVNPSGAQQQVQGAVIDGLSTLWGQEIRFKAGQVEQTNFGDYPLLRMARAPEVAVHFIDSGASPTGLGEPALPPLAPAICNAIYAASGHRVRTLPLAREGFTL